MSSRLLIVALALFVPVAGAQSTDATLVTTPTVPRDVELHREIERATASRAYRAEYDAAYARYDRQPPGERDQRRARCSDARAHRDATLRVVGLARSFDLLRALDDAVYEACRGA